MGSKWSLCLYKSKNRHEYRYLLHVVALQYTESVCVCVSIRDLLLRDNLFEIITSSRTFYIQVKLCPHVMPTTSEDLSFPQKWLDMNTAVWQEWRGDETQVILLVRAERLCVPRCIRIELLFCKCSAADVWHRFFFWSMKSLFLWKIGTAICYHNNNNVLPPFLWENSWLKQQS